MPPTFLQFFPLMSSVLCTSCSRKKCKCVLPTEEPELEPLKTTQRRKKKAQITTDTAAEPDDTPVLASRTCLICLRENNGSVIHGSDGCPFAHETLCDKCGHRGHYAIDCTTLVSRRPTTIEELIPFHLRVRWNITSRTPFKSRKAGRTVTEEICDANTLIVTDTDSDLRRFVKKYGVSVSKEGPGRRSEDSLHDAIDEWGIRHGYRILYEPAKKPKKNSEEKIEHEVTEAGTA